MDITSRELKWGQQCGGKGGSCQQDGQCVDGPWQGWKCPSGAQCVRRNEWHWQCDPLQDDRELKLGQQCGGKGGSCQQDGQCVDGPWQGWKCPSGAQCVRRNEWHWQCDPLHDLSKPYSVPSEFMNKKLELKWMDDFASSTSVDTINWEYHFGDGTDYTGVKGWGNNELQCYSNNTDNINIINNALVLTAKRGGICFNPVSKNIFDADITSGKIISRQSFMYGENPIMVTARIQVPMSKGSFPAFWLIPMRGYGSGTGTHGQWCLSGEIDVMEHVNEEKKVQSTLIYGYPNQDCQFHRGDIKLDNPSEWHIYTLFWSKKEIKTFVDGNLIYSKNIEGTPLDNPMHIVLNLAVGGDWAGSDDPNLPFSMSVDYVMVHDILL